MSMNVQKIPVKMVQLVQMESMHLAVLVLLGTLDLNVRQVQILVIKIRFLSLQIDLLKE